MTASARYLNASEAARRLGVSVKALRLYEQRGLVVPVRSAAGWRAYGPSEIARASEIVMLRGIGLSLQQVARVMAGDQDELDQALTAHQAVLEARLRELVGSVETLRGLRSQLAQGVAPTVAALMQWAPSKAEPIAAFTLPWPWGGEMFELRDMRALNYIIGPLGSGKTRLAHCLAEALPDAAFLGLDRLEADGKAATLRMNTDPNLKARVEAVLEWMVEDGAVVCDALLALVVGLEDAPAILVIDMIEQGLDEATQEAVIAYLRRREPAGRSLFMLTRSRAILDLAAVGDDETIILCPANHSPPSLVVPTLGALGYEAVATCLASPAVRARSAGMIAWRPEVV